MATEYEPPPQQPPTGTELFVSAAVFIALVLWNWWP